MGKHKEYNEDLCNSVVNNCGITKAKTARQFGVSKQLVCAWIKIKARRGTLETKPRSDWPRKTTKRADRQLCQMSKGDARLTGLQVTSEYNKYSEVKISDSTVKRCLRDENLFGRHPSQKPLISKKNWMARVKFAKEHLHWTKQD